MSEGSSHSGIEEDWYASAFDALYPVVYAHRSVESARPEVEFAVRALGITSEDHVLDLCCGNGRHMLHLLDHAKTVHGLDFSQALLGYAREHAGLCGRLVRGDMRALPFRGAFDIVVNFFTSFGYFGRQEENQAVLASVACALRPEGRFLLDYLNPRHVEAHLVPHSERTMNGYAIHEERWIDTVRRRINKKTLITTPEGRTVTTSESVRLYTRAEMEQMCLNAGLAVDTIFGDYSGASYSDEQPRMIITGHRTASYG